MTLLGILWGHGDFSYAQAPNVEEANVPAYTLPDPLTSTSGEKINSAEDWFAKRRGQLLTLFQQELYGRMPSASLARLHYEERQVNENAFDGKAIRKEGTLYFNWPERKPKVDLLIYLPKTDDGPFPAFLGLNFLGNHTVSSEPDILISDNNFGENITQNAEQESQRGVQAQRWQIETVIDHGYALVTAYYEDIAPDFSDGKQYGVWPLFLNEEASKNLPKASAPACLSAWAWGLSRILDILETMPEIDACRVAVHGHSRLGKTALWAGANDPRFAMVISNNSGCGGAALSRREFGETLKLMHKNFPYWTCENSRKYLDNVAALPIDQHELICLIAPRPVYIASATEDLWADPRGEFLSALAADPVYRLLETDGIAGSSEFPEPDTPIGGRIHYHLRTGKHDITLDDWQQFLLFADRFLK